MFKSDRTIEKQLFAFTPRDLIPDDCDVWLYTDLFESLDLEDFYARYSSQGQDSLDCRLALRTIFYGITHGICSGRKLEAACRFDNRYMVLVGGYQPSFRTFHRFFIRHEKDIENLFLQIVHLAQKMNLVSLGNIAIDGTRIKANASRKGMLRYEKFDAATKAIKEQIQEFKTKLAEENHADETDSKTKLEKSIATRERRLERIKDAKARLDKEYKDEKRKNKTRVALNDTDARFMGKDGANGNYKIAYNCQASVDSDHQIIVAAEIQDSPQDAPALIPMIQKTAENCGKSAKNVLADKGYATSNNILEGKKLCDDLYIAMGKNKDKIQPERSEYVLRSATDGYYECLSGRKLKLGSKVAEKRSVYIKDMGKYFCDGCTKTSECLLYDRREKYQTLVLEIDNGQALAGMIQKSRTAEFWDVYKRRKAIVEPVFGNIKWNKMIRLYVTRKNKVAAWWKMIASAHNIEKILGRGRTNAAYV